MSQHLYELGIHFTVGMGKEILAICNVMLEQALDKNSGVSKFSKKWEKVYGAN